MDDHGDLPVVVRFYADNDRDVVEHFRCAWRKWERDAERIIREAPSIQSDGGVEILIAISKDNEVVGVAVFDISDQTCEVYSLGVLARHHNRHIGTQLKKAVMVEAESRFAGCKIASTVHRRNDRMNKINANLQAVVETLPGDSQYLLTLVEARLVQ